MTRITPGGFEANESGLVVGTIVGERSWNVNKEGRLVPLHRMKNRPWHAGVNHADCDNRVLGEWTWVEHPHGRRRLEMMIHPGDHVPVGTARCRCGFYAYHVKRDGGDFSGAVDGIVEGYGVVTVGSKGFRCQKARILALVPRRGPVGWFLVGFALLLLGLLITPKGVFDYIVAGADVLVGMLSIGLGIWIAAKEPWLTPWEVRRLKRRYPDARFFWSMKAARAAFPLSGPPAQVLEDAA